MKNNNHNKLISFSKTVDDEVITKQEVVDLIKEHQLKGNDDETIKAIYNELDKIGLGHVKRSSFFAVISKNKAFAETSLKRKADFFFQSAGEKIIMKLKKIKNLCIGIKEDEAVKDIDWIIETLTNKDLNDFDINELNPEAIDALKQYSQAENKVQRSSDLKKVTVGNKFSSKKTLNQYYKLSQNDGSSSQEINLAEKKKGRSSLFSISNTINAVKPTEWSGEQINLKHNSIVSIDIKTMHQLNGVLNKFEDFDFNIFELNDLVDKSSLFYLSREIFDSLYLFDDLICEDIFKKFILKVSEGYSRSVKYHNDLHAADVLQTTYILMEKGSIYYKCNLTELDYISILIGAICHDYKHPGIGNSYLINTTHNIALSFNGKNILILY